MADAAVSGESGWAEMNEKPVFVVEDLIAHKDEEKMFERLGA